MLSILLCLLFGVHSRNLEKCRMKLVQEIHVQQRRQEDGSNIFCLGGITTKSLKCVSPPHILQIHNIPAVSGTHQKTNDKLCYANTGKCSILSFCKYFRPIQRKKEFRFRDSTLQACRREHDAPQYLIAGGRSDSLRYISRRKERGEIAWANTKCFFRKSPTIVCIIQVMRGTSECGMPVISYLHHHYIIVLLYYGEQFSTATYRLSLELQ